MSYAYKSRRFPYRTEPGDDPEIVRREIHLILCGVQDMIYQAVRKKSHCLTARCDHDVDDMVTMTMEHLWQHALPRYDREHRPITKVQTYLFISINNYLIDQVRHRHRKKVTVQRVSPIDPLMLDQIPRKHYNDRRIQQMAEDILNDPERMLTKKQADVLRLLADNQELSRTQMARMAGYTRTNPLRNIEDRIVECLLQVDPADYEHGNRTVRHAGRVAPVADPNPTCAA